MHASKLINWVRNLFLYPMPVEMEKKVCNALVAYVYEQLPAGLISSLICSTVILIGFFNIVPRAWLFAWYGFSIVVLSFRYLTVKLYNHNLLQDKNNSKWRYLIMLGACCGGIVWALMGIFLLPETSGLPLVLMVLVIAGVSAAAVPLLSGVVSAALLLLVLTLLPTVIHLWIRQETEFVLLGSAIAVYLVYLIALVAQFHRVIAKTIYLQFELEVANEQLAEAATHDGLTKIANRYLFELQLSEAIKRAERQHKLIGIFYIDLDQFKAVNDTFGHQIGDELLIEVVDRIENKLRHEDFIARLGGDEFAVILENIDETKNLTSVAMAICQTLHEVFFIRQKSIYISASIGISLYPIDGDDVDTLLKKADSAMYVVKKTAKGNFQFVSRTAD